MKKYDPDKKMTKKNKDLIDRIGNKVGIYFIKRAFNITKRYTMWRLL